MNFWEVISSVFLSLNLDPLNIKCLWFSSHTWKIANKDFPISGGTGELGCFRVPWFAQHKEDKQKLEVQGGGCWVLAVEFGDVPRAYSVLAYGQSDRPDSPYFNDQLEMFAANEMKVVAFAEKDIQDQLVRTYRPGKE